MPYYEVQHCHPLSEAQQDQLAEAITHIHSRLFTTPALFVHVAFTDNNARPTYMAGKRRKSNLIVANVRNGPSRTKDNWTTLCQELGKAWRSVVAAKGKDGGSVYVETDTNKLRAIFVLGSILTGWEGGFMIPDAGKDREWFQENLADMHKAAQDGDGDMADMLEEIKGRDEFKSLFTNGH